MSTLNVPVKDIGLYPDSVNPVHRQPSGTSVSNFSMLMGAPLVPVSEIGSLPGRQTTESDALTEMLEFTRLSMENQFLSAGSTQGAVSTPSTSTSTLPVRSIDVAASANDGHLKSTGLSTDSASASASSDASSSSAANAASQKVQQVAAVVVPDKKPAPTFFQSLRRQFSKT
jgi:hypothetical protein